MFNIIVLWIYNFIVCILPIFHGYDRDMTEKSGDTGKKLSGISATSRLRKGDFLLICARPSLT